MKNFQETCNSDVWLKTSTDTRHCSMLCWFQLHRDEFKQRRQSSNQPIKPPIGYRVSQSFLFMPYIMGGEVIYYHGPHEFCISAGGPQNQLILKSTFI